MGRKPGDPAEPIYPVLSRSRTLPQPTDDGACIRDVAVKLLHQGLFSSPDVEARFRREAEVLEITVEGPTAFSRRIVTESYTGPDGETTPAAKAALAEVWRRDGEGWRLQRVTVHPIE